MISQIGKPEIVRCESEMITLINIVRTFLS